MLTSNAICPVSSSVINERVARINGGFTLFLLVIFVSTQNIIPVLFLSVDFLIRSTGSGRSPVSLVSKALVSFFKIGKKSVNAGPKIFAARIGLLFSVAIGISFALNLIALALTLSLVIGVFSLLESAFGICVACEIYPMVYKIVNKSDSLSSRSKTIPYTGFGDQ